VHFLFNVSTGGRQEATARLEASMWGIGQEEWHRDELSAGDLALIYVAPEGVFIGRAQLATAAREWRASEGQAYPGDSESGVVLRDVELWDHAVPMATVAQRIDPTASNPLVQANAKFGFPLGVVRITRDEYEAVVAASREY
jgi:hypothetical protein